MTNDEGERGEIKNVTLQRLKIFRTKNNQIKPFCDIQEVLWRHIRV